ncbi:UNVERIFIED_CONTAM: hypothetical protein Sindi_2004200 [Sesamum indicum]
MISSWVREDDQPHWDETRQLLTGGQSGIFRRWAKPGREAMPREVRNASWLAFASVADHPLGPATDHALVAIASQLANQTQAPPRADSSFCSSAYGVLAAVSSCCSPPKGRFLRVTHPSATGNTTSHKADFGIVFHSKAITCIHALHIRPEFAPRNIAIPAPSRQSHEPLIPFSLNHGGGANPNIKTHIGFRDNQARTDDFHHVKVTLYR